MAGNGFQIKLIRSRRANRMSMDVMTANYQNIRDRAKEDFQKALMAQNSERNDLPRKLDGCPRKSIRNTDFNMPLEKMAYQALE